MDEPRMCLRNNPDKYFVGVGLIFFVIFVALGSMMFAYGPDWLSKFFGVLFGLGLSLAFLVPIFYFQYVMRPKTILVSDAVTLYYRTREPRTVALDDIEWIKSNYGDQGTFTGRVNTAGRVKVRGDKHSFLVTYEIARKIDEMYAMKLGRHPPRAPKSL